MRRDRLACILVSEFDISCQARRLESEIDARLAAYSKIGDAITLATTSSASSAPEPSEAHAKAAVSTTDSRGDRDYLGIAWRQRLVFKPLMQNVGGLDSVAQV